MSKTSGSKGRGRNRSNSSKRSPGRSNMHDSQSGRNRGNAQQLLDKYLSLARDSLSQGDRVAAENFFQHADHFQRIITEKNEKLENRRRSNQHSNGAHNSDNIDKNHKDSLSSKNDEKENMQDTHDKSSNEKVSSEKPPFSSKGGDIQSKGNGSFDNKSEILSNPITVKGAKAEDETPGLPNPTFERKE